MKKVKFISAIMAAMLAETGVVSVSAATLTNENPDSSTEVTARIEGTQPGDVSYVITIPDMVDFGTLAQPQTDTQSNKYLNFDVTATELKLNDNNFVSVYINGQDIDDKFYITQKDATNPFKIKYDIYSEKVNDDNVADKIAINDAGAPGANGFHFTTFSADSQGQVQEGTLVLNQQALYGQDLDAIAGNYSGTMTFHSSIVTI